MARELLEELELEYHVVNFEQDQFSVLEEVKAAYGWNTVPIVLLKDGSAMKFIGGYTELKQFDDSGQLDELINTN